MAGRVFYGLFVESTSLCIAARVWELVEPVFRAVDLIKLRKSQGKLTFRGRASRARFSSLPDELARNELFDELHGEDECECWYCGQDDVELDLDHLEDCGECADMGWDLGSRWRRPSSSELLESQTLENFLLSFGLCDFDTVSQEEEYPSLSSCISSRLQHRTCHTLTLEALPANANERSRKLFSLFPLETVLVQCISDPNRWSHAPVNARPTTKEEEEESKKPAWQLWAHWTWYVEC
ncbi:hypothetical protein JCM8547_003288 [Rhodosporidiobolus lusitaniae]